MDPRGLGSTRGPIGHRESGHTEGLRRPRMLPSQGSPRPEGAWGSDSCHFHRIWFSAARRPPRSFPWKEASEFWKEVSEGLCGLEISLCGLERSLCGLEKPSVACQKPLWPVWADRSASAQYSKAKLDVGSVKTYRCRFHFAPSRSTA